MRRGREELTMGRRRVARTDAAGISPLPSPEDVFVEWLLSLPHDADIEDAARRQVELIDRCAVVHADILCLRLLLVAVAEGGR